jgi:hypothetical protein
MYKDEAKRQIRSAPSVHGRAADDRGADAGWRSRPATPFGPAAYAASARIGLLKAPVDPPNNLTS